MPDAALAAAVDAAVAAHAGERGPLLEVLHGVQAQRGWIEPEAVDLVAAALNLSRAEVHGVVTFYTDLRSAPPPARTVRVCGAEACQASGGGAVLAAARAAAGDVEEVFCFGNCALGPTVEIDGELHGLVRPDEVAALVVAPTRRRAAAGPAVEGGGGPAGTVFLPADSAARSVGADDVADALVAALAAAGHSPRVVRTGSRGALWLEPLLEVVGPDGRRHGFGPVSAGDVESLVAAGALDDPTAPAAAAHPLAVGPVEELPWFREQTRLTFARCGLAAPLDLDAYEAHGGWAGLRAALALPPEDVLAAVERSGLRGRGGAGFPAGTKWRTVAAAVAARPPGAPAHVVANADEGDSGTFADRLLLEGDPFALLEGMAIAAHAVGATDGWVYVRSEYPAAVATLRAAVELATAAGVLGADALGPGRPLTVRVRVGAGAYICGEETAMLESIEGKRGVVRAKPPLPAVAGLWGEPTVVNNVLTLAAVPHLLAGLDGDTPGGADHYASLGTGRSRGTQVVQLAGDVARGGIVEVPFGTPLRVLVERFGGGTRRGRPLRAVQAGGPLGAYLPATDEALDLPLDYEAFAAAGAMVGHGGLVLFDDSVDLLAQARFAMRFCAEESCGKCTPCRVGSTRGVEVLDRVRDAAARGDDAARDAQLVLLEDLCEVLAAGSLCAMGGLTPMPVRSAMRHFPEDFERPRAAPAPSANIEGHAARP